MLGRYDVNSNNADIVQPHTGTIDEFGILGLAQNQEQIDFLAQGRSFDELTV